MSATRSATVPGSASGATVFDLLGPLPAGTTVLEASAGTGKTFTIAALVTRYVAEGIADLPDLLVVTFGRAATSELRDRVRERLVSAERELRAGDPASSGDALVRHLGSVPEDELCARRARLRRALAQFDAATIATTHGFCQQLLGALGIAADVDPDAVLAPDLADLVDEVVDDEYVRLYAESGSPPLSATDARTLGHQAVSDPHARLEPRDATPGTPAHHRFAFAEAVTRELMRRKRNRRVLDYDDLLTLVRDALDHPAHGDDAVARVRERYRVVLVDEFQDTDPVQWQILRRAFHGHRTLILIGDPKQAIYAFRGGDVVTYLAARRDADTTATLDRNWRSDSGLLAGLDRVLGGAALGDPQIVVRPVRAEHPGPRHQGVGAPVRLRHVRASAFGAGAAKKPPLVGPAREAVVADVVADVVRQLRDGRLREDDGAWRPVRPGDIAVLARRNADVVAVREALVAAGVPAVFSAQDSVFASAAAQDWLTLLVALEEPGHSGRTAAAALTPFLGWTASRLAAASDAERDGLADQVRSWSRLLGRRGVAALLEAASARGLAERLLRTTTGERRWTDVRHIAQVLHEAVVADGLGLAALTDWLRRRVDEAAKDYAEERSRRLETDAAAVQVVTVHASKGLEFPIVYVPFAWDRHESDTPDVLTFHDEAGHRVLHLGRPGSPGYDAGRLRHLAEDRGESLRLLYVALTRARSQVVVTWVATARNTAAAPLTRVLLGGAEPGEEPPASVKVPADDAVAATFAALAGRSGGTLDVEAVAAVPGPVRWEPPAGAPSDLAVASFTRTLDAAWARLSYTRLTAAAHETATASAAGGTSEPEVIGVDDEPDGSGAAGGVPGWPSDRSGDENRSAATDPRAVVSPLSAFPGGAAFGTLVHTVLETLDTSRTGDDLDAEVLARCRVAGADRFPGVTATDLAAALGEVLRTPLGPAADGLPLAAFAPRDRLSELEFELPLAGGDTPHAGAVVGAIGDLLADHLPDGDPFRPYAQRLRTAAFATSPLRGYLTGSLDSVLRLTGPDGPRFLVVDYKTNRLGVPDRDVTAWDYRPDALVAAMSDSDYVLQLLLYLVALHRYLRWRLPGYDPQMHLGGGLYLFVRGMCGPQTPVLGDAPTGVLAWRPPASLVVALSSLLDGTAPPERGAARTGRAGGPA